jgi:hypothetical protein
MKNYKQFIRQLPNNTLVCALGDFSPPTTAHEMLIKTVKVVAEERSAEHIVFTSPSDLIREEKKQQYLKIMFPETNFVSLGEANSSLVFKKLTERFKNVVLVIGEDQIEKYKYLKESNVEIISITEKNPDSDQSKMKQYATKGIYEDFKKLLPSTIRDIDAKLLMNEMRYCMDLEPIKEQIVLVKDKLREQYFRGEIFNIGDIVESAGLEYEIVKRGSNHLLLKDASGELVSKWIQDVTVIQEAVIQPTGTDKIETNQPESSKNTDTPVKPKGKVKGFLTFYNYDDNKKTIREEDLDEQLNAPNNTANKFNNSEAKAKIKAQLVLKHAKEKETLSQKHAKEKLALRNEAKIEIPKDAPSVETIAAKHNVSVEEIKTQLNIGMKIEAEHGKNPGSEREIALDHLNEKPDYYKKLKRFVEGVAEPTGDLKKACWKNYTAVGTKKKNGKTVPNCVPVKEDIEESRGHKVIATFLKNREIAQRAFTGQNKPVEKKPEPEKKEVKEGFDDYHAIAKELVKRHGKNVDTGHINDLAGERDSHRGLDHSEIMHHVNKLLTAKKEVKEEKLEKTPLIKKLAKKIIKTDETDQIDRTQLNPTFDPFFKEQFDLSDQEINDMVEHVSEDEIMSLFEESEWSLVYEDTEEEVPVHPEEHLIELMEVLSRQERMRGKIRLRKTQAKRNRSTKISLHRYANPQTINKRARRLAIKLIKQRMLRGRNLAKISVGEKERIEKTLAKRKDLVNRVAQKLVVRIRRVEKARMSKGATKKGSMPAVF